MAGCSSSSATPATTSTTVATTSTVATPASSSTSTTPAPTTIAPRTIAPKTGRGLAGKVSVFAGSGKVDGAGIPGPAASASLGQNVQFAVAPNGDAFVSTGGLQVLKISGGQVTVFAQLDPPGGPGGGVAVGLDGSVFVATSNTVVKFTPDGHGTVVLRSATAGLSTSLGPIAVDPAGNVYVADGSRRITRIAVDGTTSAFAGTGTQAPPDSAVGDGGPATASPLGAPTQMVVDSAGNLLIADASAHRVRRVAPDGTITTIAGGGTTVVGASELYAPDGALPTDLRLAGVTGVAVDGKGRIYVADGQSHAIFRFGTSGGIELVIADQQGAVETAGSAASQTRATNVGPLAIDPQGNLLYVQTSTLREIAGAGS
jgi:sugar lactone lactonase YvrE